MLEKHECLEGICAQLLTEQLHKRSHYESQLKRCGVTEEEITSYLLNHHKDKVQYYLDCYYLIHGKKIFKHENKHDKSLIIDIISKDERGKKIIIETKNKYICKYEKHNNKDKKSSKGYLFKEKKYNWWGKKN